jgi:hypothetical protein
MAALAEAGMPATGCTAVVRANRNLRAHEHERLPAALGGDLLGEEDHGRDADAAANEQRALPLAFRLERPPDRAHHVHALAAATLTERARADADDLVQQLDPAFARARAHDRVRPPHRQRSIAAHVHEAAGTRRRGTARRMQTQHELRRRMRDVRDDLRVFYVDGVALAAHRALACSASVRRTAMRTATPFATWVRMTDCGPSATSLSISTSRFMGPGCITIASGRASARRFLLIP